MDSGGLNMSDFGGLYQDVATLNDLSDSIKEKSFEQVSGQLFESDIIPYKANKNFIINIICIQSIETSNSQ